MPLEKEKIELLSKYIENVAEVLEMDDINDILDVIDDAIVSTFDKDGNPSADGIEMQKIFDLIYEEW